MSDLVGKIVKIIDPGPDFYKDCSLFNKPNPYLIGALGVVRAMILDRTTFEIMWAVEFQGKVDPDFFFEAELEIVEDYFPPEEEARDRGEKPEWADDPEAIRIRLYSFEYEDQDFASLFGPYFRSEDEVRHHLEDLLR